MTEESRSKTVRFELAPKDTRIIISPATHKDPSGLVRVWYW